MLLLSADNRCISRSADCVKAECLIIISLTLTIGFMVIIAVCDTDPHIKVTGTKEAVAEAKEKILNILNTNVQTKLWHFLLFITLLTSE